MNSYLNKTLRTDPNGGMLVKYFERSFAIILLITAVAKIVSAMGVSTILLTSDPVFLVSFRLLLLFVAFLELCVATICLFGKSSFIKVSSVAWLSTLFLLYHVGMRLTGYHRPCGCMGNLTDAIHLPPQMAAFTTDIILAYLLITSYTMLCNRLMQMYQIPKRFLCK